MPFGSKKLSDGERRAIETIKRARKAGVDDPAVDELESILLLIARADPGYRGRYVGDRLRSVSQLLDRLIGKPREQLEHTGKVVHEVRIKREGAPPSEDGDAG